MGWVDKPTFIQNNVGMDLVSIFELFIYNLYNFVNRAKINLTLQEGILQYLYQRTK